METKSQSVSFTSFLIYNNNSCGRGNLIKIHTGSPKHSSAVRRQLDVYVNGTGTEYNRTSKLMRLEVLLSKMVWNSFWRSILLKEFLGRAIAPLIRISRYSEFIQFVFLSLETEYETQRKIRKLSVAVHSLHATLNLI